MDWVIGCDFVAGDFRGVDLHVLMSCRLRPVWPGRKGKEESGPRFTAWLKSLENIDGSPNLVL
jgi:hypothetical protein